LEFTINIVYNKLFKFLICYHSVIRSIHLSEDSSILLNVYHYFLLIQEVIKLILVDNPVIVSVDRSEHKVHIDGREELFEVDKGTDEFVLVDDVVFVEVEVIEDMHNVLYVSFIK